MASPPNLHLPRFAHVSETCTLVLNFKDLNFLRFLNFLDFLNFLGTTKKLSSKIPLYKLIQGLELIQLLIYALSEGTLNTYMASMQVWVNMMLHYSGIIAASLLYISDYVIVIFYSIHICMLLTTTIIMLK